MDVPSDLVCVYSSLIRVLPHTGQVPLPWLGIFHNTFPRLVFAILFDISSLFISFIYLLSSIFYLRSGVTPRESLTS